MCERVRRQWQPGGRQVARRPRHRPYLRSFRPFSYTVTTSSTRGRSAIRRAPCTDLGLQRAASSSRQQAQIRPLLAGRSRIPKCARVASLAGRLMALSELPISCIGDCSVTIFWGRVGLTDRRRTLSNGNDHDVGRHGDLLQDGGREHRSSSVTVGLSRPMMGCPDALLLASRLPGHRPRPAPDGRSAQVTRATTWITTPMTSPS